MCRVPLSGHRRRVQRSRDAVTPAISSRPPARRCCSTAVPSALLAMKRDGVNIDATGRRLPEPPARRSLCRPALLFLAATYDTPRQRPLTIVGPPGTEARVQDLFRAMYRDLAAKPLPFELRYIEVADGTRTAIGAVGAPAVCRRRIRRTSSRSASG